MAVSAFEFEKPIAELEELLSALKAPEKRAEAEAQGIDLDEAIATLEGQLRQAMRQVYGHLTPWEKTLMARHKDRPYSLDMIRLIFDDYMEMSGDRLCANDEAIVAGFAHLAGKPLAVTGQQKGRDLKERQRRNFGSARAEGFRKALRVAQLAARFGKPVVSFVDTAGAAADLRAEQHGVSEAIARNLAAFSVLPVPTVAVVIGEGGSGGAIALGVADRVLMLEHAIYSVIAPEGCAAILWHDKAKAAEAADALRLTAQNALELGLIDEVVAEPLGGAHRDPAAAAAAVREALERHLAEIGAMDRQELLDRRYKRLRSFGVFGAVAPDAEAPAEGE
ncbi:MAG: acetyl-CoA carboxylase carboxyltransferase subunit alpha [Armatimonadetes bacterium]|nr:acetyl-CoA carboxylase carboxyltransferase subunit alpha [Armatimonadota bacterium]